MPLSALADDLKRGCSVLYKGAEGYKPSPGGQFPLLLVAGRQEYVLAEELSHRWLPDALSPHIYY